MEPTAPMPLPTALPSGIRPTGVAPAHSGSAIPRPANSGPSISLVSVALPGGAVPAAAKLAAGAAAPSTASAASATAARAPASPRILLTATLRWPIAARLAIAFADLGCEVEVLCPSHHPARHLVRAVTRWHGHALLAPLRTLRRAIEDAEPDLIIPCDDQAATDLATLHQQLIDGALTPPQARQALRSHRIEPNGERDDPAWRASLARQALCARISRSLGRPAAVTLAASRAELMALARAESVPTPATVAADSWAALDAWLPHQRGTVVLKVDGSWGGLGVAIVHSAAAARRAFATLRERPPLVAALMRSLIERDPACLLQALSRAPRQVSLQAHVAGRPANRAVACWQGEVVAGISVEAVETLHPTGPATVVRVIEHAQMTETARRLVRRLGLSGLWGLDFMLDADGEALLIEVNPRATPICHLRLGPGHDLPAALLRAWGGAARVPVRPLPLMPLMPLAAVPAPGPAPDHASVHAPGSGDVASTPPAQPTAPPAVGSASRPLIALFPGEWQRRPDSPHLLRAHHDIPWSEPGLVRDGVALPWAERGWLARLRAALRGARLRTPAEVRHRTDPGRPAT